LIVFNHPLWDTGGLASQRAQALVKEFLDTHGRQIHALEVNGLRSWPENREVVRMARELGHVVISGGDRHGLEANAVINMTCATTIAEFVDEVRYRHSSDIAFLSQYGEPLPLRHLRTAWDLARQHPQLDNRRHWINRVFVQCPDGVERPLSSIWTQGAPGWIEPCLNVMGMLTSRFLRAPFRLAYSATRSLAQ
jgi:hypothetical protein